MKRCFLISFIFVFALKANADKPEMTKDTLPFVKKGWYVSSSITKTWFFFLPLLNRAGNANPDGPVTLSPGISVGYRIKPRIRVQGGVSYFSLDLSKYAREGFYGNENHFTADDHGRFLYLDAKVKGYALRPKFPLQPYLGLGLSDLGYELERHHIVYDSANIQKFSVSNRFYGILPHAALDVGLQLRVLHFLEIYAEFNARFLINKAPAIWGPDANYLPSVTYGVNWHF